jgi:SAM-dependent methyltransferase
MKKKDNICAVCGYITNGWVFRKIISNELATEWKIDPHTRLMLDKRESLLCPKCHNSFRSRAFAEAIIKIRKFSNVSCLREWVENDIIAGIKIAEINACGGLHRYLKNIPNLYYSEYGNKIVEYNIRTTIKRIIRKLIFRIPHQDIMKLSYPENFFDLVIHSDTLEHVPDPIKSLKECIRVLKPGGYCLFSVPLIENHFSVRRAYCDQKGKIRYIKSPSFHGSNRKPDYLVYWEFGKDFIKNNHLLKIIKYPKYKMWVLGIRKK